MNKDLLLEAVNSLPPARKKYWWGKIWGIEDALLKEILDELNKEDNE